MRTEKSQCKTQQPLTRVDHEEQHGRKSPKSHDIIGQLKKMRCLAEEKMTWHTHDNSTQLRVEYEQII